MRYDDKMRGIQTIDTYHLRRCNRMIRGIQTIEHDHVLPGEDDQTRGIQKINQVHVLPGGLDRIIRLEAFR